MRKIWPVLLATALISACARRARRPARRRSASRRHPGPARQTPIGKTWGLPNGNILNELDKLSVRKQGQLVSFRDRKTIFNLKKENFLSTPRHKVSINSWQIDCSQRTFRLLDMVLFDENGRQIASFTYNDNQIKPMPVVQNSASYQQMLLVCKGEPGF